MMDYLHNGNIYCRFGKCLNSGVARGEITAVSSMANSVHHVKSCHVRWSMKYREREKHVIAAGACTNSDVPQIVQPWC